MSDARAKAEARRAKILARESSMKVQAIGDDLTLPVDGKPQERPLAKRRTYVKSVAEKSEESTTPSTTPQKVEKADDVIKPDNTTTDDDDMPALMKIDENPNTDDPDVDSIADHSEKHHAGSAPSPAPASKSEESNNEKKNELLKKLSPKKTLKEIEEEVARNTAKYDADTLKDDDKDEKQGTKSGMKRVKVNKETAMKNKAVAVGGLSNNINPSNVTRLVRMFVIIALGAYKGFYAVQDNMNTRDNAMIQAMEGSTTTNPIMQPTTTSTTTDEFGDPTTILSQTEEQQQQYHQQAKASRTWAEYIQYKLTAPFESTITAVGISYWFANMLSSGINSRLKAPPKPKGILEQVMSLYQSGFEGILEYVFCLLGEYGLHLGTILLVATVLTLYTEIPTVGNLTPAAVVAAVTENIAKIEL